MKIANTQGIKNIAANGGAKAAAKGQLPKEGEVIEGKIINSNRGTVDVLLNNGQKLRATVKGRQFFNIGDNVKFIVKSSDLTQLILKGVSNNSIEDKLIKVLENAGERANEKNIEIVKNLFDEGMPVNKETVSKFVKLGLRFKGLTPKMLISFEKLGIPFNKVNVDMVSKLISGDKPLFKDVEAFMKALTGEEEGADKSGDSFSDKDGSPGKNLSSRNGLASEGAVKNEAVYKADEGLGGDYMKFGIDDKSVNVGAKEGFEKLLKMFFEADAKSEFKGLEEKLSEAFKPSDMDKILNKLSSSHKNIDKDALSTLLKDAFSKDVSLDKLVKSLLDKGLDKDGVFKALREVFAREKIEEKLFIKAEEFSKKDVKEGIKNTLRLAERVGSEELSDDIKAKAAKLTETIRVMDRLTQDYNFVHIPLMVNDKEGNAEIYLKKSKARREGKDLLKALLRLDFMNMGHLDIMVGKEAKNISLTFYSEDKLDDVKENISILRKDLAKAGFSLVECEYKNEVGESNMASFFSGEEEEEKPSVTFDMRA